MISNSPMQRKTQMEEDIEDFRKDLLATIQNEQATNGTFGDSSFFSIASGILQDCEAIDDCQEAECDYDVPGKGHIHIDGYDPSSFDTDESITLIAIDPDCLLRLGTPLKTINRQECEKHFKAMLRFADRALTGHLLEEIEESTDAYDLANYIHENHDGIIRFRLHFITDRLYTGRSDKDSDEQSEGKDSYLSAGKSRTYHIEKHIWDISRLLKTKETMTTDETFFIEFGGGGIPAVKSDTNNDEMSLYLMFIPAESLAEVYQRYGSKLMEANVRSFLSLRGKINKGINRTLKEQPEDFVAFNNGITATATHVEFGENGRIVRADNLQIVNGGQTTATIFYSQRKQPKPDLSRVRVPVKLIVVDNDAAHHLIPQISKYSNRQNKVEEADFSANNQYQVMLEKLSKRVFAPMPNGSQTHWYYERMRGQYDNAKNQLTGKDQRDFTKLNPKSQVIKMVEAAKYQMCWDQQPHIASYGNQKCFARFVQQQTAANKDTNWSQTLTEDDYKQLVCKTLMFRSLYKLVKQQDWFEGSYRVNIVEYAMAKFAHDLQEAGKSFDAVGTWARQGLSDEDARDLLTAARLANDVLLDDDRPVNNVSEWAKKEDCWKRLRVLPSCLATGDVTSGDSTQSAAPAAESYEDKAERFPNSSSASSAPANNRSDSASQFSESASVTVEPPKSPSEDTDQQTPNPSSVAHTVLRNHEKQLIDALQTPSEKPFQFIIPDLPNLSQM